MCSGRAGGGDGYALAKGRWKSVKFPSDSWVRASVRVAVFRYDGKYVLETVVMYLSCNKVPCALETEGNRQSIPYCQRVVSGADSSILKHGLCFLEPDITLVLFVCVCVFFLLGWLKDYFLIL